MKYTKILGPINGLGLLQFDPKVIVLRVKDNCPKGVGHLP
jgi:hypothetical protein